MRPIEFCLLLAAGVAQQLMASVTRRTSLLIDKYVCYNTMLEIVCSEQHMIVFDAARYGRNNSQVALLCNVPYTRHCDVDVHFHVSRACAGRRHCSLRVGPSTFADPCGYNEFLVVSYRCISVSTVDSKCRNGRPSAPWTLYSSADVNDEQAIYVSGTGDLVEADGGSGLDRGLGGFLASPGYPMRYHPHAMTAAAAVAAASPVGGGLHHSTMMVQADCRWILIAQRFQTIRVTLLDFELDVRRNGLCHDRLDILGPGSSSGSSSSSSTFVSSNDDIDDFRFDESQLVAASGDDVITSARLLPSSSSSSSVNVASISVHDDVTNMATDTLHVGLLGTGLWRKYFSDCGALGKHVVDVPASEAIVKLTSSQHGSGPTQRGFLLHYEAIGPGCVEYEPPIAHSRTVYWIDVDGQLVAETKCTSGYVLDDGTGSDVFHDRCIDLRWNSSYTARPHRCIMGAGHHTTSPAPLIPPSLVDTILPLLPSGPRSTVSSAAATGRRAAASTTSTSASDDMAVPLLARHVIGAGLATVVAATLVALSIVIVGVCCHYGLHSRSSRRRQIQHAGARQLTSPQFRSCHVISSTRSTQETMTSLLNALTCPATAASPPGRNNTTPRTEIGGYRYVSNRQALMTSSKGIACYDDRHEDSSAVPACIVQMYDATDNLPSRIKSPLLCNTEQTCAVCLLPVRSIHDFSAERTEPDHLHRQSTIEDEGLDCSLSARRVRWSLPGSDSASSLSGPSAPLQREIESFRRPPRRHWSASDLLQLFLVTSTPTVERQSVELDTFKTGLFHPTRLSGDDVVIPSRDQVVHVTS